MAYIYKITNPKGRVYIGSTTNINKRFGSYKRLDCKWQSKLYNSLLKYGADAHKFEIITECNDAEMFKMEAVYGHMFNVFGPKGMNCVLPAHGTFYKTKSPETREKIRQAHLGKSPSEKTREKIRNTLKDRHKNKTPEELKALSNARKGRKLSEEHKRKISMSNKGKPATPGIKNKKKAIDTVTGIIYDTIKEAAIVSGYTYIHFTMMLTGRKTNKTTFIHYEEHK